MREREREVAERGPPTPRHRGARAGLDGEGTPPKVEARRGCLWDQTRSACKATTRGERSGPSSRVFRVSVMVDAMEAPMSTGDDLIPPSSTSAPVSVTGSPPAGQGSDMTKEEVREQAKQAVLGRLTKEEEEERSTRNKEMLPSEKNLGHMTLEEKFDFARRYKEAGNVFFKENKYEFALKNYTETITYLRHGLRMGQTNSEGVPLGAMRQELDPESKEIIASCQSNMAACALKLGRMEDVVKHASAALDQDIKGETPFRTNPLAHARG